MLNDENNNNCSVESYNYHLLLKTQVNDEVFFPRLNHSITGRTSRTDQVLKSVQLKIVATVIDLKFSHIDLISECGGS